VDKITSPTGLSIKKPIPTPASSPAENGNLLAIFGNSLEHQIDYHYLIADLCRGWCDLSCDR